MPESCDWMSVMRESVSELRVWLSVMHESVLELRVWLSVMHESVSIRSAARPLNLLFHLIGQLLVSLVIFL